MKRILVFLYLFLACLVGPRVLAIDYQISSYEGHLSINPDNTATYQQVVTYDFEEAFNGQYVTLGTAGKLPEDFAIDSKATQVVVAINGKQVDSHFELEDLGDGYRLKVYNGGEAGDRVTVGVLWQLKGMLYPYQDIAELNWIPISDWDEDLNQVVLTVTTMVPAQDHDLQVHLGYLKDAASISYDGKVKTITYDDLPAGDHLELHAYWDRSVLYDVPDSDLLARDGLTDYQAVEDDIAAKMVWAERLFFPIMPATMLSFVLLAAALYGLYLKSTTVYLKRDKKARLYEAPANLSPLLVANNVYSTEMLEASPIEGNVTQLTFENILQATLLDLIDRGFIIYEIETHQLKKNLGQETIATAYLGLTDKTGLSEAEQVFVQNAFDGKEKVAVEDLFSSFAISKDIMEGERAADEAKIQASGRAVERKFQGFLKALDKAVVKEIKLAGLPCNYRQLTGKEDNLIFGAMMMLVLGAALQLVPVFLLSWEFFWHFGLASVIAVLINLVLGARRRRDLRDGVLTVAGAEVVYEWQSFRNMIRDIGKFDQTEVQGHLIWNRLLVYATLFGLADKVEAAMKLRHLHFENASLNLYTSNAYHHHGMRTAMHSFANYGSIASSASHFSVSSGSGGGFSGGGGGGGGGAF